MERLRERDPRVAEALQNLEALDQTGRNLQMPGDGRYQPKDLRWALGYDNWSAWITLVEWFWLVNLGDLGKMPTSIKEILAQQSILKAVLQAITTTMVDDREYGRDGKTGTNHDINAQLALMRQPEVSPAELWKHFHTLATSYDPICTAYAWIVDVAFERIIAKKLVELDTVWRAKIKDTAGVLQMGRTHLQHALPITAGCWLAWLHSRFADCSRNANRLSQLIPGKFSGAVGTGASQMVFLKLPHRQAENGLMAMLGLPPAGVSTQIAAPEANDRFYHELVLLSGTLANLGDDCRKLQAPEYGEVVMGSAVTSTSSTMAQKTGNPIAAEQSCGMHVDVICGALKTTLTLISDFQRDLRWSSVMRSYSEAMVYLYQQLNTALRLVKNLGINTERCRQNFAMSGNLVTAELLHLALQEQGLADSHGVVNKIIVPAARQRGGNLSEALDNYLIGTPEPDQALVVAWRQVNPKLKRLIATPEEYVGYAREIAEEEALNAL